tara:strand:+ start:2418 stop:2981 length:564 start_codon:yes stop_codon:yes gene_type:complete
MVQNLESVFSVWKKIFSRPRYLILGVIVAFLFYEFNVLINGWQTLSSFYGTLGFFGILKLFMKMSIGFGETISTFSFVSLLIISAMFGMLFSILAFKVVSRGSKGNKKVGFLAGIGVFLGALVPGCAACGIGLASLLGLGAGVLTFLPYDGLEISLFAIAILGFVIVKVSKDVRECSVCQVRLSKDI